MILRLRVSFLHHLDQSGIAPNRRASWPIFDWKSATATCGATGGRLASLILICRRSEPGVLLPRVALCCATLAEG